MPTFPMGIHPSWRLHGKNWDFIPLFSSLTSIRAEMIFTINKKDRINLTDSFHDHIGSSWILIWKIDQDLRFGKMNDQGQQRRPPADYSRTQRKARKMLSDPNPQRRRRLQIQLVALYPDQYYRQVAEEALWKEVFRR